MHYNFTFYHHHIKTFKTLCFFIYFDILTACLSFFCIMELLDYFKMNMIQQHDCIFCGDFTKGCIIASVNTWFQLAIFKN